MSGGIIGHPAPMFDEVDRDKFREVVPSVETDDLASIIDVLKKDKQLDDAKVFLLGWSEGTMIASLVAEKFPDKVEAILLAGYAHENLYDIIAAQFSGRSFNDQSQSCL
jgi:pimeloyl-ACP methyl ester carboxylesterase